MTTYPFVLDFPCRCPPGITEEHDNVGYLGLILLWHILMEQGQQGIAVGAKAGISLRWISLEMFVHPEHLNHLGRAGVSSEHSHTHDSFGRIVHIRQKIGGWSNLSWGF